MAKPSQEAVDRLNRQREELTAGEYQNGKEAGGEWASEFAEYSDLKTLEKEFPEGAEVSVADFLNATGWDGDSVLGPDHESLSNDYVRGFIAGAVELLKDCQTDEMAESNNLDAWLARCAAAGDELNDRTKVLQAVKDCQVSAEAGWAMVSDVAERCQMDAEDCKRHLQALLARGEITIDIPVMALVSVAKQSPATV